MYIYCADCGGRTLRGLEEIKFCSKCGSSFNKTLAAITPVKKAAVPAPAPKKVSVEEEPEDDLFEVDFEDDDYEEEEETPRRRARGSSKPQNDNPFDLEVSAPRKIRMSDIAGTSKEVIPLDKINVREKSPKKKISSKKFLEQFKDETRPVRRGK